MTPDAARWESANNDYLSTSLVWLRLKLLRLAEADPVQSESNPRRGLFFWYRPTTSPRFPRVSEKQLTLAEQARHEAEQINPAPALLRLARQLGLSPFERDTLLLCAALELDSGIASLCAAAQGDAAKPFPTFELAMRLFKNPAWEVMSPDRPLRFWRLIDINQPGAQPLTASPLRADERILNCLKGLNYVDDRLASLLTKVAAPPAHPFLSPSQESTVETILQPFARWPGLPPSLIQLVGVEPQSKLLVAEQVVHKLGLKLFRLPAEMLGHHESELETLMRLWYRESLMLPVALFLDAHETDSTSSTDREARAVRRFLERMPGLVFVSTRGTWTGLAENRIVAEVGKPTVQEQQDEWSRLVGARLRHTPQLVAGQFSLNLPTIQQIAACGTQSETKESSDKTSEPTSESLNHDAVWQMCLLRTRPKLDSLAQRIDAKATFNDLVVPDAQLALLWAIVGQARHRTIVYDDWGFRRSMNRGLGISALFAGESGTGKTMAAEVIANELQLNLYRIDLSAVVSKYIGETEKNLRCLFDAAEEGGAILFFDEADSLFGKRSEVKDSHDRYANISINYLLQRIESFGGLTILATNMKSALDKAFMRRLRFIVEFPFPSVEDRKAIWQRAFPWTLTQLDYDFLARLNVAGGSIHNIALNSAFLAVQNGLTEVTMPLVLQSARIELLKLDRHINEADFHWELRTRGVA